MSKNKSPKIVWRNPYFRLIYKPKDKACDENWIVERRKCDSMGQEYWEYVWAKESFGLVRWETIETFISEVGQWFLEGTNES